MVRPRRIQRRDGDTVVKLRPVVPDQLPKDVRRSRNLVVEVDARPGGYLSVLGPITILKLKLRPEDSAKTRTALDYLSTKQEEATV